MARRLHYIDWLRVLAVLLLFPFHTSRVFNYGEDFYIKGSQLSMGLNYVLGFIDMWHMPLLFLLAGASAYFSLRRRSAVQFAQERMLRLFVPIVFGIFVIMPPQTWIGAQYNSGYTGSFVSYITSGAFLRWNIQDAGDYYGGFGIGHLWFILFLLLISLIALPLMGWQKTSRGTSAMARFSRFLSHPLAWLPTVFVIYIFEGLPEIAGKNLLYYLVFFVLGFAIMCDERFLMYAEKYWVWALPLGLALCAGYTSLGAYRATLPDPSWPLAGVNLLGHMGAWLTLVGFLGFGRRALDRASATLSYLAEGSYPIYILHQTLIVVAAFYVTRLDLAWPAEWLLVFVIAVASSFGLYEVVRRASALRFVFGMRPKAKPAAPAFVAESEPQ